MPKDPHLSCSVLRQLCHHLNHNHNKAIVVRVNSDENWLLNTSANTSAVWNKLYSHLSLYFRTQEVLRVKCCDTVEEFNVNWKPECGQFNLETISSKFRSGIYVRKTEMMGLFDSQRISRYVQPFWHNAEVWLTDERMDGLRDELLKQHCAVHSFTCASKVQFKLWHFLWCSIISAIREPLLWWGWGRPWKSSSDHTWSSCWTQDLTVTVWTAGV